MFADFIDSYDARWTKLLKETRHDCYHLPEYVELVAGEVGASPMAFYAEQGDAACLIPLLVRPIPPRLNAPTNWLDCMSPYGYSGILLSRSQERVHSFLDAFCYAARARGFVTAFIRLHPLFPLDHGELGKFGRLIRHGRTVYMNLSESTQHIWQRMSSNHKRNITGLLRAGFHCSLDDWGRFQDFVALYHATMRRVGAPDAYFFSVRYFDGLREKLGKRIHLACVLNDQNDLAAAGLFIATERIVQYHLGGTVPRHLPAAPSKLMMDFVWRWAQQEAHEVLHLGGGVGGAEDSLFRFKAGFSPACAEFYTYRIVVDESKYEMLCQAAQLRSGTKSPGHVEFFPQYRDL